MSPNHQDQIKSWRVPKGDRLFLFRYFNGWIKTFVRQYLLENLVCCSFFCEKKLVNTSWFLHPKQLVARGLLMGLLWRLFVQCNHLLDILLLQNGCPKRRFRAPYFFFLFSFFESFDFRDFAYKCIFEQGHWLNRTRATSYPHIVVSIGLFLSHFLHFCTMEYIDYFWSFVLVTSLLVTERAIKRDLKEI